MAEDGTNSICNASMLRALMRTEARLQKAKEDAAAAIKSHHGRVKTYGMKVKNFSAVFAQMTAADEGDEYIQNLKEQRRLAMLLDLPIGAQMSFIDEFDAIGKLDESGPKSYRDGARAHLNGVEETDCPHDANTVEGQEWLRGYRWSADLCGEGEREIKLYDEGLAGPDDAAEGTIPAEPKKKRGRPKKTDAHEGDAGEAVH